MTIPPKASIAPTIPSTSISLNGKRLWLLTCGDFATHAHYAQYLAPMDLEVDDEP